MTLKHVPGRAVPDAPGARPAGEWVTLRFQADGAEKASLRLWWDGRAILEPMERNAEGLFERGFRCPKRRVSSGTTSSRRRAERPCSTATRPTAWAGPARRGIMSAVVQITVYDPAFKTPGWMRETVVYQIMVDRFHASRPVAGREPPERGHWHADWYEPPSSGLKMATTRPTTSSAATSKACGGSCRI
jgi:hypothetical protein